MARTANTSAGAQTANTSGKPKTPQRNNKVKMKKKSYKALKKGNKSLRRISDSSFNQNLLSESKISTPVLKGKRAKKLRKSQTPQSKRKRKLDTQEERSSKRLRVLDSSTDSKPSTSTVEQIEPPRKVTRLPTSCEIKNAANLQVLFRNDFLIPAPKDLRPPQSAATSVAAEFGSESIIILDDDDDDEQDEEEDTTPKSNEVTVVEAVGQELMGLATADPVPESPHTLINKVAANLEDKENEDTIVLDDSQDDGEDVRADASSPDSVIILDEKEDGELTATLPNAAADESVQEIAAKYFTPAVNMDFIPLSSNPPSRPPANARRKGRKNPKNPYSNFNHHQENNFPRFEPNMPQNFNFGARVGNPDVFRFQGARKEAPPPAIYSDDSIHKEGLRPIVIDGSNIAFAHGKSQFSVKGIEMVIKWFKERGHETVVAFLPQFRVGNAYEALNKMESEGTVIFTPSRKIDGRTICSYDDRFILDYAVEKNAIVISRDNYRDMYEESSRYRETIEKRILMPTFVGNTLMFPQDPLGKNGPRLDEFLKF